MNEIVRKNLQRFREETGLTQERAALLSGVKLDNLRRYESGKSGVSPEALFHLARIYGHAMEDFYKEHPPRGDLAAVPLFHASASMTPAEMDKFEGKWFREIQETIVKANAEVRAHRIKTSGKTASSGSPSGSDKNNKPGK